MHSPEMDRRRRSFERGAQAYDRLRPGYPDAAFDLIRARAGDRLQAATLEVGAGTGRATLPLARLAAHVTAVEPSADMLAVLRRRVREAGLEERVTVRPGTFEDVDETFAVVVAAQSFHWADPATRWPRLARMLHPDGRAFLLWNGWHFDPTVHDLGALRDVYARLGTNFRSDLDDHHSETGWVEHELAVCSQLRLAGEHRLDWPWHLTTDDYLDLLCTTSQFAIAEPAVRDRLLDALAVALGPRVSLRAQTLLLEVAPA